MRMAEKKPFALRMDAATMKAIEKWAADEFRSVNGQIEWVLHRALREAGRIQREPEVRPDADQTASGRSDDKRKPDKR
jgi:hypothetical protein